RNIRLQNGLRALLIADPTPRPHDGFTTSESSDSSSDTENKKSGEDVDAGAGDGGESTSSSCSEASSTEASSTPRSDTTGGESSESEEGDEKLAACALLIDYGSFAEPVQYPGMAHFLEHMIFMGSEKYPVENIFDAHIKKCGGFSNANTDCEETLFYFEVAEKHLDSSLDYFTALMKAPLMKKEAMQRERMSVDSEFQQIVNDDETRRDQLLASLAAPGFPHGIFTWGNMKSLKNNVKDDELHKVLHEAQKTHYVANHMYLCLQARLPMDELESLVLRHFAEIPNNDVKAADLTQFDFQLAFKPEFYEQVFFVKPVENECKLELTWVLPNVRKYYRSKPDQFLSYLLGYEGRGSLCAYLRRRLWGLNLIAGIDENGFDMNSMYALFNVCIYLTDDGFIHLDDVLTATFAYVKLFSEASPGSLKTVFEEQKSIEDTNFRFQAQRPAFDNVQELVVSSKYYPPKDILTAKDIYYEYDEEELGVFLGVLNQMKFNLMITSRVKYEDVVDYNLSEEWFGTEYATLPMPEKWCKLWKESKPMDDLFLPEANRYVTEDFTLFWHADGKPEVSPLPKKLLKNDVCELWFRQDDKYDLPEAHMAFYFISPLPRKDVLNNAMTGLYEELIKFYVSEELYPASSAGLAYSLSTSEKGLCLKVSGYNEKLHLLVEEIAKGMVNVAETVNEEILAAFCKNQRKNYFNLLIKPRVLNRDIRLCLLEQIRFLIVDKYKCLNDVTLEELRQFMSQYPKELYIQVLVQGNYTEESAHNVLNSVITRLNCKPIKERQLVEDRTVQLPLGTSVIRCLSLNDQDTNTVITNFYQMGPNSIRVESILDLMMMFVDEPLFDQLRTKEQLGYHVGATVRLNYGIAGYSIMVNSQESKTAASYVEGRIEAFRVKMLQILRQMPQDEYEHSRDSLIKLKQVADVALTVETGRNWDEITNEEYLFDRRKRQIEVLRTLGKAEIIEFLLNADTNNLRKLSIQVIGHKLPDSDSQSGPEDTSEADDMEVDSSSDEKEESVRTGKNVGGSTDDLFAMMENKVNIEFLPRTPDDETNNVIVNIAEFKKDLEVYPKTKGDADGDDDNNCAAAHLIEDALGKA
ncbi:hypothetical protein KR018_000489, partial [Drosophila ironensis]